jgi:hypothetical protein
MKVVYIECTEGELRANRGIMDAIIDAVQGVANRCWGMHNPVSVTEDEQEEEDADSD